MTIILFLLVLALLIFVHELGHFLACRLFDIKVSEFAIGFGPKIWGTTRGETTYQLNLIPFGGYVKIFGETPDEVSMNGPESGRSFINKPKWKQVIVLGAGVTFNALFAWILLVIAFTYGVPASLSSYTQYADRIADKRIIITHVLPGSPAEISGLKVGESLRGFTSVEDIREAIDDSADKGIVLNNKNVVAKKGISDVSDRYAIGISMEEVGTLALPFHLALLEGTRFTIHVTKLISIGLYDLIAGIFNGKSNFAEVTGPVGIAGLVRDAADLGLMNLIRFTALISLNLGVINLIPFPALDGGRILFVFVEFVTRRRIHPKIANSLNTVGFALLLLLMVVVTYKDIIKLFVK